MSSFQKSTVEVGNKTVTLLSNTEKDGYRPLVSKVVWEASEWNYTPDNHPKGTRIEYLETKGLHYALVLYRNEVIDYYVIEEMHSYFSVCFLPGFGIQYEGRNEKEPLRRKFSLAREIGLHVKLTPTELIILAKNKDLEDDKKKSERLAEAAKKHEKYLANLAADEAKKAEAAKEKEGECQARIQKERDEREAREQDKKDRITRSKAELGKIERRTQLKGYRSNGAFFRGTPVTSTEWEKLPGGAFCVLVESYNDDVKEAGKILSCFIIEQKGSRKKKVKEGEFFLEKQTAANQGVRAVTSIVFKKDGEVKSCFVYRSTEDIEKLQKAGLNGGAVVATRGDTEKEYNLFSVSKKGVTSIGKQQADEAIAA